MSLLKAACLRTDLRQSSVFGLGAAWDCNKVSVQDRRVQSPLVLFQVFSHFNHGERPGKIIMRNMACLDGQRCGIQLRLDRMRLRAHGCQRAVQEAAQRNVCLRGTVTSCKMLLKYSDIKPED